MSVHVYLFLRVFKMSKENQIVFLEGPLCRIYMVLVSEMYHVNVKKSEFVFLEAFI